MSHDHHAHAHSHEHAAPADFGRAFAIGIALNLAYVAVEAGYGLAAGSLALLADAGHNLGDVLGLALSWGAAMLGRRGPSARFTYGLRSSTILAVRAREQHGVISSADACSSSVRTASRGSGFPSSTVLMQVPQTVVKERQR